MSPLPTTFLCDMSARGRLKITGEDRARFINGQVTNDVKALESGRGCYAAFTNAKGKMRADGVILNAGGALYIDVEPGVEAPLAIELEKYIIADDVQIEPLTTVWAAFALVGDQSVETIRQAELCEDPPSLPWECKSILSEDYSKGLVYRTRYAEGESFAILVDMRLKAEVQNRIKNALDLAGGEILPIEAMEILRVEAGIPRFGVEMDESTLPQEAGIEAEAISYSKGCYLGQEVIARIKSVGHVNRTLVRVKLSQTAMRGDILSLNGKEMGKLGSAVLSPSYGEIGLAIIRREGSLPGTALETIHGTAVVVDKFKRR